ncbi:DUF979 domain-containing protein [Vagococcus fluvialis]|uniref:DUF979 domain-containing protein n=1 Tax=Vagococcus fluvialis TaxID=2738 RepID=UPI001432A417|nr:DUF979 domain-containing protein [Vagococcus fluvialis]MBO0478914.1 DUF979 domain-containing protein [Vagococcus fluvialis]MBO0483988.1 DUF979 domain-containing protein [Vagococcus fluvialis]MBO0486105.1 DUF979 domain-containing protein [Vagococcus fluvialis]MDT2746321.1 DUF979 domain-containing protein [Vagococcus fluvialis]NKC59911.1 DUF979 domain-containing protein [Vagococcus fluvialis]
METFFNNLLEFFFILIGLQLIYTAYKVFTNKSNSKRIGTSLFWLDLGLLFMLGKFLPNIASGLLVVLLGVISLFRQFEVSKFAAFDQEKLEKEAKKYGNKIFIPVLSLAVVSVVLAFFIPLSSKSAIGVAAIVGIILAMLIFGSKPKHVIEESDRMVQTMGTSGILPQLLAALGAIFTIAGVGDVISQMIGGFVPEGNRLAGVTAYVLGMVVFTIIMGNGFAAFTVITAGVGLPFVIAQGADPAIAGALALTAGYCGTLLTPMAANFNVLPASLLEMKNPYGVIKEQVPVAVIMIIVHIALMYFWAF